MDAPDGYWLHVTFLSNERPWSGRYAPYGQPHNDADAITWAQGMREGMGALYQIVLMFGPLMVDENKSLTA